MSISGTFAFYTLIILTASSLSKFAYSKKYARYKSFFLFLAILILSVVAGLRYEVGSDWLQYYSGPDLIGRGEIYRAYDKGSYELGYILICKIIYMLGLGGTALLFIYGFLTYLFVFLTIDIYSDSISVPFALFVYGCLYYLVSFNITRQALAISIAMYAISHLDVDCLNNTENRRLSLTGKIKNNTSFFLWGFVAFIFHQSGIISLLALPICYLMRKRNIIRWAALGIVSFCVVNFRMFTQLAIMFTGSSSFQWYFIGQVGEQGSWMKFLLRYLPMLLFVWMASDSLNKNRKIFDIYNLFLVGLIVNSLSVVSGTEIERIGFPFLYFLVIMMGFAYKNCQNKIQLCKIVIWLPKGSTIVYKLVFSVFVIWTMWYIFFYSGAYKVVPYQTALFR